MEYRRLGKSGLKASEIALGCGSPTFAGRADEKTSLKIIHHALDLGINCVDTGETYAEGRSETLLGKGLKGRRSNVIIATKFAKDRSVGPSEQRASRTRVMKAVEGSLKRLQTDYIDLYIMHEPDPETPIEETLRALDDLIHMGKVRYIACADFASWQVSNAFWTSVSKNLNAFVAASAFYNLINRGMEKEVIPCCLSLGIGVVPTTPLAGGFLTGKYRRDKMPKAARFTQAGKFMNAVHKNLGRHDKMLSDENFDRLEKLEAFAEKRGHTIAELAIAWLLSHPWLGMVPVGVTKPEQLAPHVKAAAWKLTDADLAALDKII